ncbi:serine/threonine protein kinase [Massilia genomosp. 1]|uniref:Protein kinase n=1 Tax=Massilia genomosp. 1 TaxID=2609280 RepID=A0ABX0MLI6_9BURK|nr:serine/threonine-protein kinase [Massilia genomosp. 1]NHZ63221.1 protein kinase [Massilia genomosp. 1]
MRAENNDVHVPNWGVNSLPQGTILHNKYEVVGELGSGGFGIVYEAKDQLNSGTTVAIKEYFPQAICGRHALSLTITPQKPSDRNSYQKGKDAFVREAYSLREVRHSGIIAVYETFEDRGNMYFIMERLQGGSLQLRIDAQTIPTAEQATQWLHATLDALSHLHAINLLHLDISPSNILINDLNKPVLIDFGAARQAVGNESMLLTTIAREGYTPYEQYNDYALQTRSPATDVYALGATFYHLLSGAKPLPSLARKLGGAKDQLRPLSELVGSKFPSALVRSIETAMAVEPGNRWNDAGAWLKNLGTVGPRTREVPVGPRTREVPRGPRTRETPIVRFSVWTAAIIVVWILIAAAVAVFGNDHVSEAVVAPTPTVMVEPAPVVPPAPPMPEISPPGKPTVHLELIIPKINDEEGDKAVKAMVEAAAEEEASRAAAAAMAASAASVAPDAAAAAAAAMAASAASVAPDAAAAAAAAAASAAAEAAR